MVQIDSNKQTGISTQIGAVSGETYSCYIDYAFSFAGWNGKWTTAETTEKQVKKTALYTYRRGVRQRAPGARKVLFSSRVASVWEGRRREKEVGDGSLKIQILYSSRFWEHSRNKGRQIPWRKEVVLMIAFLVLCFLKKELVCENSCHVTFTRDSQVPEARPSRF